MRGKASEFVGGKDTAGACPDNNNVVLHTSPPVRLLCRGWLVCQLSYYNTKRIENQYEMQFLKKNNDFFYKSVLIFFELWYIIYLPQNTDFNEEK